MSFTKEEIEVLGLEGMEAGESEIIQILDPKYIATIYPNGENTILTKRGRVIRRSLGAVHIEHGDLLMILASDGCTNIDVINDGSQGPDEGSYEEGGPGLEAYAETMRGGDCSIAWAANAYLHAIEHLRSEMLIGEVPIGPCRCGLMTVNIKNGTYSCSECSEVENG